MPALWNFSDLVTFGLAPLNSDHSRHNCLTDDFKRAVSALDGCISYEAWLSFWSHPTFFLPLRTSHWSSSFNTYLNKPRIELNSNWISISVEFVKDSQVQIIFCCFLTIYLSIIFDKLFSRLPSNLINVSIKAASVVIIKSRTSFNLCSDLGPNGWHASTNTSSYQWKQWTLNDVTAICLHLICTVCVNTEIKRKNINCCCVLH